MCEIKCPNCDITNFEEELDSFKADALLGTDRNLRLANDEAQNVTIKRLTRGNPTMAAEFAELEKANHDGAEGAN